MLNGEILIDGVYPSLLNFEEYLKDILNRMLAGDTDYESMIPCNYKPRPKSAIMPEFEAVVKVHPELALRLAIA